MYYICFREARLNFLEKIGGSCLEFVLDWYSANMDKIDEASVEGCLLTQGSVVRPWIL